MRTIKLSGRELSVIRAVGFSEPVLGSDILDHTRMEPDDVTDTINSLMSAGFVESVPYCEQTELAIMPVTAFEVNPAYVHEIRIAMQRR
jgi:hypothetical protein